MSVGVLSRRIGRRYASSNPKTTFLVEGLSATIYERNSIIKQNYSRIGKTVLSKAAALAQTLLLLFVPTNSFAFLLAK